MLKECYEQELCALWNYYDIYIMDLIILKLATLIMPTSWVPYKLNQHLLTPFSHNSSVQPYNLQPHQWLLNKFGSPISTLLSKFGSSISTLLNRYHSGTYHPLFGDPNEKNPRGMKLLNKQGSLHWQAYLRPTYLAGTLHLLSIHLTFHNKHK
jgi:hypothetical protein